MSDRVLLEKAGDTASLTLNRPEKGNAVDSELMTALIESLAEVAADKALRVLVIEGRGEHFCSGREPDVPKPENASQFAAALGRIVRVNELLQSFPGISVAVVRGKAFGFGCGLAVQSDVTLAADDARFAFPEINAGFPPTIVMSYLSRWIHRKKALELVMTGGEITAQEAERQGWSIGWCRRISWRMRRDGGWRRWPAATSTGCRQPRRSSETLPSGPPGRRRSTGLRGWRISWRAGTG